VLHKERREAGHHFEEEVAEGPPVRVLADIDALLEDFWREILRGACDEVGLTDLLYPAAESEVHYLHVALAVDEYVFGFETRWKVAYSR
jgi:hypothetical protein